MIGARKAANISRSLKRLNKKGIEFIQGEVRQISPEERRVRVGERDFHADALILALGAELADDLIPGLAESGHNLYTLDGAQAIRDALSSFNGGQIIVLTAAPMYKCPAAPYEAAMLLEYDLRRRGLKLKTQISLYASEPGPMGTAGPEISAAVKDMVESKGIKYFPGHQVVSVIPGSRLIEFANGARANFDLLIYVPPHRAPAVVKDAGLLAENGWVAVDRHIFETKHKLVFAIGDMTAVPLKMGKPLPKAGVFAHAQAEVVARNIARVWTGKGEPAAFDGFGECFIETGDHRAGIGRGNFYAEPVPQMTMKAPSLYWHLGKVLFEKRWLWKWF